MKRLAFLPILFMTLLVGSCVPTGELQTDVEAHEKEIDATEIKILMNLANVGDANAQYKLCYLYVNGFGVPKDYKPALKWCKLAAEHGLIEAQFSLGIMYLEEKAVPLDFVRAYMWFKIAEIQGHEEASKKRLLFEASKRRLLIALILSPADHVTAELLADEWLERNQKEWVREQKFRGRSDRELCITLKYGNPDYLKEAERRGLTNRKCKQILSAK